MTYPFAENIEVTDEALEEMFLDAESSYMDDPDDIQFQTMALRKKRRDRRIATIKTQKHWQKSADHMSYPGGLVRIHTDDETGEQKYRRTSCLSQNGSKSLAHYIKRRNNKKVRRTAEVPSRSGYKKLSEYKWELI